MIGAPDGTYYIRTEEYEYDNALRPNFGIDEAITYEPIPGMGDSNPYVRMLSSNNRTRCSSGPETWEYTYNENGLPVTMYNQWADLVPVHRTVYRFFYRKVEK